MTTEPQGSPPPGTTNVTTLTVVPPAPREIRVVTDAVPMLDTARFEHMQRIAVCMAETSIKPDSLCMGKDEDGKIVELPMRTIVANCFMVVNQAVRWHMDPFAVAQCASVVHGRLMWEGKLVAAVLDANLGVRLSYQFTEGKDQDYGVVVSGHIPGEAQPRTIRGKVKDWHKGPKSPWANPGDWERQLCYRGAREWARIHAPGIMLGVLSDDEADEAINARQNGSKRRGAAVPLAALPDIPDDALPVKQPDKQPDTIEAKATDVTQENIAKNPDTDASILPDTRLADPKGFLNKLSADRALCENEQEAKELAADQAENIKRLSPADQKKAAEILRIGK